MFINTLKNNFCMANDSDAALKKRAQLIFERLKRLYPGAGTALKHRNPLELLVSTILSAQCTDERVNKVTPELFKKYKTSNDYANADRRELEKIIYSTGFYKNKAKNIINMAKMLVRDFNGRVPKTMAELIRLPGVARKTANIVLTEGFGIVEGIAIDRHCIRVSNRLCLTKNKDSNKIERDLTSVVPKSEWRNVSNLLIWHGRRVCKASVPICSKCVLDNICPKVGVTKKL